MTWVEMEQAIAELQRAAYMWRVMLGTVLFVLCGSWLVIAWTGRQAYRANEGKPQPLWSTMVDYALALAIAGLGAALWWLP